MNKAFWVIVAIDAALFLFLLIGTLMQHGPADGGREMALAFSVIIPGIVIGLAILLYVFSHSPVWRILALLIVAGPGLLLGASRLRNTYLNYKVEQNISGRGYFSGRALKEMGAAVVQRNLAALQQAAPNADVNTVGNQEMTLLRLAVEEAFSAESSNKNLPSEFPIVRALLSRGAKPNPGLEESTKLKDPAILGALLDAGADPNLNVSGGPVAFAWINILPAANLRLLAEHGANLSAVDQYGTPLVMSAAAAENWDCAIFLIEQGADVHRTDASGRTLADFIAGKLHNYTNGQSVPNGLQRVHALLNPVRPG